MIDYDEILKNLNHAEALILQLNSTKQYVATYVEAMGVFKNQPNKALKLRDCFTFDIYPKIKRRVREKQNICEQEILKLLQASSLSVEYLEEGFTQYCQSTVTAIWGADLTTEADGSLMVLRPSTGDAARSDYQDYLDHAISKKGCYDHMSASLGKFEQVLNRYLNHMQAMTLNVRTIVAISRCH